mgnify:CR=1 FL=1
MKVDYEFLDEGVEVIVPHLGFRNNTYFGSKFKKNYVISALNTKLYPPVWRQKDHLKEKVQYFWAQSLDPKRNSHHLLYLFKDEFSAKAPLLVEDWI